MVDNLAAKGHGKNMTGPCSDIPGVVSIYTYAGERQGPLAEDIRSVIDVCRELNADAAAIEYSDRAIVATVNSYDNACAIAKCSAGTPLSAVARGLQARLFELPVSCIGPGLLPAATVCKATSHWERMIAVIFGKQFAAGLVAAMLPGSRMDEMTLDDLEKMRRTISSALGDCMDLQKVDK